MDPTIPSWRNEKNLTIQRTLLSSISKLLEKIVAKKLVDHLLDNDLLYVHQYGFLPNRSTEHNLLQIVNYVSQALNEGNYRSVLGSEKGIRRVFA
jgi:phage antirepressor YoqD-like protein